MKFTDLYKAKVDNLIINCEALRQLNSRASDASIALVNAILEVLVFLQELPKVFFQKVYVWDNKEPLETLADEIGKQFPQAIDDLGKALLVTVSDLFKEIVTDPSKFIDLEFSDKAILWWFDIKTNGGEKLPSFFQALVKQIENQQRIINLYDKGFELQREVIDKYFKENNSDIDIKTIMSLPPFTFIPNHNSAKTSILFNTIPAGICVLQDFLKKENEKSISSDKLLKLFTGHCTEDNNIKFLTDLDKNIEDFANEIAKYQTQKDCDEAKLKLLTDLLKIIKVKRSHFLTAAYNPYTPEYFQMIFDWEFLSKNYDKATNQQLHNFLSSAHIYFQELQRSCEKKFGDSFKDISFPYYDKATKKTVTASLASEIQWINDKLEKLTPSTNIEALQEYFKSVSSCLSRLGDTNLFSNIPGFRELSKELIDIQEEIQKQIKTHDKDCLNAKPKRGYGRTGNILNKLSSNIFKRLDELTLNNDPYVRLKIIAQAQFVNNITRENYFSDKESAEASNNNQIETYKIIGNSEKKNTSSPSLIMQVIRSSVVAKEQFVNNTTMEDLSNKESNENKTRKEKTPSELKAANEQLILKRIKKGSHLNKLLKRMQDSIVRAFEPEAEGSSFVSNYAIDINKPKPKNRRAKFLAILEANKTNAWFLLIALIGGLTFAGVAAIFTVFTVGGTTPLTGLIGWFGLNVAWKSSVLLAANIGFGFGAGAIVGAIIDSVIRIRDVFASQTESGILKSMFGDLSDILADHKTSAWFLLIALVVGLTFAGVAAALTVFTVGGTTPLTGLVGLVGFHIALKSSMLLAANIGLGFGAGAILGAITDFVLWATGAFTSSKIAENQPQPAPQFQPQPFKEDNYDHLNGIGSANVDSNPYVKIYKGPVPSDNALSCTLFNFIAKLCK